MKELFSFETSGTDYPVTRRHSPDQRSLQPRRHAKIKTREFCFVLVILFLNCGWPRAAWYIGVWEGGRFLVPVVTSFHFLDWNCLPIFIQRAWRLRRISLLFTSVFEVGVTVHLEIRLNDSNESEGVASFKAYPWQNNSRIAWRWQWPLNKQLRHLRGHVRKMVTFPVNVTIFTE